MRIARDEECNEERERETARRQRQQGDDEQSEM